MLEIRRARLEREGDEGNAISMNMLEPLVRAGRPGRKSDGGFYDYASSR